jgi:hypothetical protein
LQPCPAGSTGLARWLCQNGSRKSKLVSGSAAFEASDVDDGSPSWKGLQPDMSDCKSKDMADLVPIL